MIFPYFFSAILIGWYGGKAFRDFDWENYTWRHIMVDVIIGIMLTLLVPCDDAIKARGWLERKLNIEKK